MTTNDFNHLLDTVRTAEYIVHRQLAVVVVSNNVELFSSAQFRVVKPNQLYSVRNAYAVLLDKDILMSDGLENAAQKACASIIHDCSGLTPSPGIYDFFI